MKFLIATFFALSFLTEVHAECTSAYNSDAIMNLIPWTESYSKQVGPFSLEYSTLSCNKINGCGSWVPTAPNLNQELKHCTWSSGICYADYTYSSVQLYPQSISAYFERWSLDILYLHLQYQAVAGPTYKMRCEIHFTGRMICKAEDLSWAFQKDDINNFERIKLEGKIGNGCFVVEGQGRSANGGNAERLVISGQW